MNNNKAGAVLAALLFATVSSAPGQGKAGSAPAVKFSPDPLDFGFVKSSGYEYMTLTVSNAGGSALVIKADNLYKGNAPFYIMADGCVGHTLAPSASCAIQFEFAPTDYSYSAIPSYFVLFDNASGGYQGVLMYGRDEPK